MPSGYEIIMATCHKCGLHLPNMIPCYVCNPIQDFGPQKNKEDLVSEIQQLKKMVEHLQKQLDELSSRPQFVPVYPYTQPTTVPMIPGVQPWLVDPNPTVYCPCGKTYPHTCVWC